MFTKFFFKVTTFATTERFLRNSLYEKSKHCVMSILATLKALECLKQEMTWVVGTSVKLAYNNATLF